MSILKKIRQMPDNQKKIFSFATAAVLTLIVVVMWSSFSTSSADNQLALKKTDKLSSISPMQVIKDQFSKAFADVHTSMNLSQNDSDVGSSTLITNLPVASSTTVSVEIINETATSTSTHSTSSGQVKQ